MDAVGIRIRRYTKHLTAYFYMFTAGLLDEWMVSAKNPFFKVFIIDFDYFNNSILLNNLYVCPLPAVTVKYAAVRVRIGCVARLRKGFGVHAETNSNAPSAPTGVSVWSLFQSH